MSTELSYDRLIEKWSPILEEESAGKITDHHRKAVTAAILENQEMAMQKEMQLNEVAANSNASVTGAAHGTTGANWNPVLIALVRRAMPNLMAYDLAGVQPMTGPTGLIFAMKSRYKTTRGGATAGAEAFFDEAQAPYSGDSSLSMDSGDVAGNKGPSGLAGVTDTDNDSSLVDSGASYVPSGLGASPLSAGMPTADAEALGTPAGSDLAEMGFSIEKSTVTARSRALKAEYTMELAQDLKAIHGLDAGTELANILSAEILAEINREVVRTIYINAEKGAAVNTTTAGIFDLDTDSNGRWSVERFKGLMFQLERDANRIAQRTRRGKGNMIICSADVASALQMAGVLDYTGNTFAGTLNGRYKVYIDPYSANSAAKQYYVVGYKGTSPYDAGIFYCPYVPLQMVRAVGQDTFQPKIGFKTRYGLVANPFAETGAASGAVAAVNTSGNANSNRYYQRVQVTNIM